MGAWELVLLQVMCHLERQELPETWDLPEETHRKNRDKHLINILVSENLEFLFLTETCLDPVETRSLTELLPAKL